MDGRLLRPLRGRELRYATAVALHVGRRTMTLQELADALAGQGLTTPGDPRKAISDALRWELHRGRAVRVGRGRYRSRGLARSTLRWMRLQVANLGPTGPGSVLRNNASPRPDLGASRTTLSGEGEAQEPHTALAQAP